MKTYTTKIKAIMLTSAIFTTSFAGFSQQIGDDCSTTKVLPTPALTCSQSNENMDKKIKWFQVTTNGRSLEINITHPSNQSAEIKKIELIDGDCQQPSPITETSLINNDGSLSLVTNDLVPGQKVFIKVERDKIAQGNFEMCVKEVPTTPIPEPVPPTSLVSIKPDLGQGFLVLNNQNFDVNQWALIIIKNTFSIDSSATNNPNATKTGVQVVERKLLPIGINYTFIDEEYMAFDYQVNYLVNVVGLNSNGGIVVEETNIQLNDNNGGIDLFLECGGCQSFVPHCAISCLSNSYAYRVQQYKRINLNLSNFQVEDVLPIINPTILAQTQNPFYWYTTYTNYSNICASFVSLPCSPDGLRAIGPFTSHPIPNQPQFFGPGGGLLTGSVVGILKNRGLWQDKIITTNPANPLTIGDEFCSSSSFNIQQAVNMMNGSGDFTLPNAPDLPPLDCTGQSAFGFVSGLDIGSGNCLGINPNLSGGSSADDLLTAFLNELTTCLCDNDLITIGCDGAFDPINGSPIPWINVIEDLIISDLNTNQDPIIIQTKDLFEGNNGNGNGGNGNFNGFNLSLDKSLYSFGLLLKNGNFITKVVELEEPINEVISQNDLTNITVFPSPIVGNKYDIMINAQATVTITYELRDFMGNIILTRFFNIHKDQEKIFKINHNNIPVGILFHRFVFEDGSTKSIQTIKN